MRIRDIVHASGRRLRIGLDRASAEHSIILQLSDPARPSIPPVLLDLYGAELLAGFLMNARLSAPYGELAEENCGGHLGCSLRLTRQFDHATVELRQHGEPLVLPEMLWDRLYAELMLALAHGRHLAEQGSFAPAREPEARSRLLH